MPSGLASVILHDTFFSFSPTHSPSSSVPSWKVLPLLHKLQLERLRGQEKGEEKEKEKNKTKVECIVGKMRLKDKEDLERVKPVSSGTSKKLLFIRSWRKEEEQKSRRKLEAE